MVWHCRSAPCAGRLEARGPPHRALADCSLGHGTGPCEPWPRGGAAILVVARAGGVERALVTCGDDNFGSRKAIEANGGVLENIVEIDGVPLLRYWID